MSKKSPKPKFIPPLKTAASFLRTISRSPELTIPYISPKISKDCTSELLSEIDLKLLKKNPKKLDTGYYSPTHNRDLLELQDIYKSPTESELKDRITQGFILPTTLPHLKAMIHAVKTLGSNCKTHREKLCLREKCLEHFNQENESRLLAFEETNRLRSEFSPGSNNIKNLRSWLNHMKRQHLEKLLKDEKNYKKMPTKELESQLEILDLVLKAGIKEYITQISVINIDRGDMLSEMIYYHNLFLKAKTYSINSGYEKVIADLKEKVKSLREKIETNTKEYKNKEEYVIYK